VVFPLFIHSFVKGDSYPAQRDAEGGEFPYFFRRQLSKAPFGNPPVSVPVYAQYQNNRSVVLVPDFPGIGEQLKLARVFGRPSGTETCKRPYQLELRDCPQPTEGKEVFFYC